MCSLTLPKDVTADVGNYEQTMFSDESKTIKLTLSLRALTNEL